MLQVKIVPVTAFQQNCSIVWDAETKEAVLIDAGGEPEKLKAEVEALGLTVKALWLTHGHLDHAGAVGVLRQTPSGYDDGSSAYGDHRFWVWLRGACPSV